MTTANDIADQVERILQEVLSQGAAVDPSPANYIIMRNELLDDHWILGFFFGSRSDLRAGLSNGVCYQIHQYVWNAVKNSTILKDLKTYIIFDFGDPPEGDAEYRKLHDKYVERLGAFQQEVDVGEPGLCPMCGHHFKEHKMLGTTPEGAIAPREGWIICSDESCTCFRTWSVKGTNGQNNSISKKEDIA